MTRDRELRLKLKLGKPGPRGELLRTPGGVVIDTRELDEFQDSLRRYARMIRNGSRNAAVAMAGLLRSPPADVPLPPEVLCVLADLLEEKIEFEKGKPGPKSRTLYFSHDEVLELVQRKQSELKAQGQRGETDQKAAIEALAFELKQLTVFSITANEIDQILHPRKARKPRNAGSRRSG